VDTLVRVDPGLYFWTTFTFLALVWALKAFAWTPLLKALEERRATIEKSVEDAKKATAELQRVQEESARLLSEARSEAAGIVTRSRADADRFREEMRKKAAEDAQVIVKNAEKEIQLETALPLRSCAPKRSTSRSPSRRSCSGRTSPRRITTR